MLKPRFRPGRKLLVASLGVAAISYVACGTETTSGNLAPPPGDGGKDAVVDVSNDAIIDVAADMTSGNLAPPPDAGPDANDGGITLSDGAPPTDGGKN